MNASDLVLLKGDGALMVFVRIMEVLNTIVFIATIRIIHVHSTRAVGFYKYCLYQIVACPFLTQLCTIPGPIFVLPIVGAYMYVDCTDNPAVVHGALCVWILLCALDLASILDGFNFRLRVILQTSYPKLAYKPFWIFHIIWGKVLATVFVGWWFAPIGGSLKRQEMRLYLIQKYPNVVATFDEYKSFVVYDLQRLGDVWLSAVIITAITIAICCYILMVVLTIFKLLDMQSGKMSRSTKKLHTRFLGQLGVQATVPFVFLLCPLFALTTIALFEFRFQSNFAGYIIIVCLLLHSTLTSVLTIVLYTPYRKAVIKFYTVNVLRRSTPSVNAFTSLSLSHPSNIVTKL